MRVELDNGFALLTINEDEVIIDNIEVFQKRKGTGKKLIEMIKNIAYDLSLPITLYAYPQDDSISNEDLRTFYYSCNFELHCDDSDYNYFIYA